MSRSYYSMWTNFIQTSQTVPNFWFFWWHVVQVEKKKSEWHFLYFGTVSLCSVILEMATNLVLIAYVFTYTRYMTFDENKPHSNESNNNKHSFSEFFTMHVYTSIYVVGRTEIVVLFSRTHLFASFLIGFILLSRRARYKMATTVVGDF